MNRITIALVYIVVTCFYACVVALAVVMIFGTGLGCATLTSAEPVATPDLVLAGDIGPRLLAANVKFGQVEKDGDCEISEGSVEYHVSYVLGRAGIPRPDQIIVKMLKQSSLCEKPEHRFEEGPPHLAEVGVTMRWLRISSGAFARAKTLMEDMQFVSSILP